MKRQRKSADDVPVRILEQEEQKVLGGSAEMRVLESQQKEEQQVQPAGFGEFEVTAKVSDCQEFGSQAGAGGNASSLSMSDSHFNDQEHLNLNCDECTETVTTKVSDSQEFGSEAGPSSISMSNDQDHLNPNCDECTETVTTKVSGCIEADEVMHTLDNGDEQGFEAGTGAMEVTTLANDLCSSVPEAANAGWFSRLRFVPRILSTVVAMYRRAFK